VKVGSKVFCALLAVLGCSSTYVVKSPKVFEGRSVNAAVDAASFGANGIVDVYFRVGALPETRFRAGRLNAPDSKPCQGGLDFVEIEKNGTLEPSGPLPVAGSHRLLATFWVAEGPSDGPFVLDLEFEAKHERECIRIPLDASTLRPDPGVESGPSHTL
jgi:hypothetical protein